MENMEHRDMFASRALVKSSETEIQTVPDSYQIHKLSLLPTFEVHLWHNNYKVIDRNSNTGSYDPVELCNQGAVS